MTNKIIVGIDLGTTNSVIASLEGAVPTVIPNFEGGRTTPSVVSYNSEGELLVGDIAKRQKILNSENTFYSVKRFIGCDFEEIKNEVSKVSYLVKNDNNKIKLYCPVLNKNFSPEEISALILKKLIVDAGKSLGYSIKDAVITVPAYFNDSQRTATKDAGAIAGINVLRIINEPTAAALAYGLNKKKSETVLVFDLGGGTFDVSILEVGEEIFEVLATSGDTHLGGDDFDQVIANYVLNIFQEKEKLNIASDKRILQRILDAAEKAKKELSLSKNTNINIPFVYVDASGAKHIDIDISRSKFEELSHSLFEKCKYPVIKALKDAELGSKDIDEVLLVGGSTRIPAVREIVKTLLQKELNERVNPDEAVALGAAIQGGIIGGSVKDLVLLDVTPLSLGVEVEGGLMSTVITRNSSIPVKREQIFTTAKDFQKAVDIHILQGERPLAKDNKSLGIFTLQDIPPAESGVPLINVSFRLDSDGILSVTASESTSGKQQSITIEGASTLSKEEISNIVFEAEENAKIDSEKKNLISILQDLDSYLLQIEIANEIFVNNFPNEKLFNHFKQMYIEFKYSLSEPNRNLKNVKTALENLELSKKMVLEEIFAKNINFTI